MKKYLFTGIALLCMAMAFGQNAFTGTNNITGAVYNSGNAIFSVGTTSVDVGGNLYMGGSMSGTGLDVSTNSGAVLTFVNAAAETIASGVLVNNSVYNLNMNGAGGITMGGDITVANALLLNQGILLVPINKTLTVSGVITRPMYGGSIRAISGTLTLNNPLATTLPAGTNNGTGLAAMNVNGGAVSLAGDLYVSNLGLVTNNLIVQPNTTLTLGAATSSSGGYINASDPNASILLYRNWGGITTLPTGIFGTSGVGKLVLGFGTSQYTLSEKLSVLTSVSFNSGILNAPDNSKLLEFGSGTVINGAAPATDASHVNGYVRKLGNGAFTYPVGNATNYQPVGVNLSTNPYGMEVAYGTGLPPSATKAVTGPTLNNINAKEYWDLSPGAGASTTTGIITAYWDGYNNVGINNASDVAHLTVAHYNSTLSAWEDVGDNTATASGTFTAGSITSAARSSWSPYTLGSNNGSTVLPVTLVNFTGTTIACTANLNWQTASELNSSYYGVEYSANGIGFTELIKIISKNKPTGAAYKYAAPLTATVSFYRLRLVDIDGHFSYSPTIIINANAICTNDIHIMVYPNPSKDMVNITGLTSGSKIIVYDMLGKSIAENLSNSTTIQISLSNYAKGSYLFKIIDAFGRVTNLKVEKH